MNLQKIILHTLLSLVFIASAATGPAQDIHKEFHIKPTDVKFKLNFPESYQPAQKTLDYNIKTVTKEFTAGHP